MENTGNIIHFPVGTRVMKTGPCYYSHSGDDSGIMENEIGTVIKIRSRYQGTPNAYYLYIVCFDNEINYKDDGLNNQYAHTSLKNISIKQPSNSGN
jgi:hypothetical protein